MTVYHENAKLSVFGGGTRNRHTDLLRYNALQTGLPASSCKPTACSQDGRLASTSKAAGPSVSETMLLLRESY